MDKLIEWPMVLSLFFCLMQMLREWLFVAFVMVMMSDEYSLYQPNELGVMRVSLAARATFPPNRPAASS